jgi:hypothetical protein
VVRACVLCALPSLAWNAARAAESIYTAELLVGGALNARSTLAIEQEGEPGIEIDAEYATRPFEFPVYYALRVARVNDRGTWELQFIHHKIHLENTTDEIERFEITDGFNIVTLNRSFQLGPVDARVGAGVVVAHTDSRVRGRTPEDRGILDTGYEIGGPALLVGAGRSFRLSDRWSGVLEAQTSFAHATATIADGEAETANVAFHFMFGVGYDW